jgi:hypothetical protein
MYQAENSLIVSPSDLNGYLQCRHLTRLDLARARGDRSHEPRRGAGTDLVARKGEEHEAAYLDSLKAQGMLVEAPEAGWASSQTLGLLAAAAAILATFVWHELRTPEPLVRLGILRSSPLVRANLGAMALIGGWFGFQFIATLYMQQLRGWSALETGLAIFPAGLLVALLAPRVAPLIERFGAPRLIGLGLASTAAGYALFLPIGPDSGYMSAMLPTFLLTGLGFGLAYGPLNVAATNGVAPEEQGLAGGLVNTSFQFGGGLVLAVVTAVNSANAGPGGSPAALLDGFHAAIVVSVIAAVLAWPPLASGAGRGSRRVRSPAPTRPSRAQMDPTRGPNSWGQEQLERVVYSHAEPSPSESNPNGSLPTTWTGPV